ncbi:MAG: PilZ domain-containing protein [Desulfovibrio sp.]|uniref:PilZ domain-containing protein n=1 Tax=Desulfovibrio sp. 7SRBS1 TaxID=3378064 RepID=UPI003B3C7D70
MSADTKSMSEHHFLLIAEEGPARDAYCRIAGEEDTEWFCVESLAELCEKYPGEKFSGIILDVPTVIKSSREEKGHIQEFVDRFPVLRLRWDESAGLVMGLYAGGTLTGVKVIREFLEREASEFTPRQIRGYLRGNICFNILLGLTPSFKMADAARLFTANASEGGCFIYTSATYEVGQEVNLIIQELVDHTPIPAKVRWVMPWGQRLKPSGIGVSFSCLTSQQAEQLRDFF